MTAAAVAALTVYDMVKGLERGVRHRSGRAAEKSGGRSGDWSRQARPSRFDSAAARRASRTAGGLRKRLVAAALLAPHTACSKSAASPERWRARARHLAAWLAATLVASARGLVAAVGHRVLGAVVRAAATAPAQRDDLRRRGSWATRPASRPSAGAAGTQPPRARRRAVAGMAPATVGMPAGHAPPRRLGPPRLSSGAVRPAVVMTVSTSVSRREAEDRSGRCSPTSPRTRAPRSWRWRSCPTTSPSSRIACTTTSTRT